jgi:16S rRNA (cytosine967-C5)-methyltransferase
MKRRPGPARQKPKPISLRKGTGPAFDLPPGFERNLGLPPSARPRKPKTADSMRPRVSMPPAGPARGRSTPREIVAPPVAEYVTPPGPLAAAIEEIATVVERAVLQDGRHADRSLGFALRNRRDLAAPDHRLVSQCVFALFRWRGWIEPLGPLPMAKRLMLATLLDASTIPAVCRVWAKSLGRDPTGLIALGDAPNWTARAEGFRRLLGGMPVTADPWRLFPTWFREHLPIPPGATTAKTRFVQFLQTMQTRSPLWVRVQGADPSKTWDELRRLGVKPWVHRRIGHAAKLGPEVDLYHLPPFERGELEIQDLASQAVAIICSPDPGERWWDACAGAGGKALHLAAIMGGKGVVVATDVHEGKLKEAVRRARRSPFRNISTKAWDGRHVVGKSASYDGVLVDAPCSAIGTWRRNPDARWLMDRQAIPRLAEQQRQILTAASAGVKPGGTLVYSVCTLTPTETTGVVRGFLDANPGFQLDPFTHPFTGDVTDGMLQIWPHESDSDAMFIARLVRSS